MAEKVPKMFGAVILVGALLGIIAVSFVSRNPEFVFKEENEKRIDLLKK